MGSDWVVDETIENVFCLSDIYILRSHSTEKTLFLFFLFSLRRKIRRTNEQRDMFSPEMVSHHDEFI